MDREYGAVYYGFQRDVFPGWAFDVFDGVQEDSVGAVEKSLCGGLEIGGGWIQNGQIEIRFQEAQDTVRFDDGVLCGGE